MKRENFYRRNPGDALSGMVGMTLEERGVYNTVIDLIYLTWRPLEDSRAYIAGHCGCAVQRLNPIINRLIERGKLLRFEEDGVWYLSNRRFEDERRDVKGATGTRSGRGKVEEKSGEVEEKSAGVRENLALLDDETEQNQLLTPLDRVDRVEKKESPLPPTGGEQRSGRRSPKCSIADGFPTADLIAEQQAKAREAGADVDAAYQAERFRNWAIGKDAKYADWRATWRNWMLTAIREAPRRFSARPATAPDQWSGRIASYRRNAYWNRLEWGPPPGKPGCTLSPEVLMAHGYIPTTPQAQSAA